MTTTRGSDQDRLAGTAPAVERGPLVLPVLVLALAGGVILLRHLLRSRASLHDPESGQVLGGSTGWAVVVFAMAVAVALLVVGLFVRTGWHYPDGDDRDERIDLIRGLAVVFVVLNHINIPSLFQLVSQEAIGPVSGAELFVALSGVVLGMVYRTRLERSNLLTVSGALLSRALKLYRTALVVVLSIFVLTLLPGVDGSVVTTFTDQSSGQTYGLYPNIARLLDYPVPGYVLQDILFLRLGPYQFNIMGLYVVLLALAPLMIVLLRKRLAFLLLLASWSLYAVDAAHPISPIATQFQEPFPLLTWQLLFVHGLVAGWYRSPLVNAARRPLGRLVVALLLLAQLGMVFFSLNNPFLSNPYDLRLALIPDATFNSWYQQWFGRPNLDLGRLVGVGLLLVALYALTTTFWKPLHALLAWFLVPLGQATLYVFVVHIYVSLLIGNVPALNQGHVLLNTVAHALTLALLWVMVKRRFLFNIVPR